MLATDEERRDPLALFERVRRRGVTIMDLVPSHWRSCIEALIGLDPAAARPLLENRLRLCLSASEALRPDVPRAWSEGIAHPAPFRNMFGHTETTGIVATYPVPADTPGIGNVVPLGRPIAGMRLYVLDDALRPVPFGCTGEVCVGGPDVARGYLNRPDLTAEKFVRDPFGDGSGRLYRTGDFARYLPGGELEYVGRMDHQVKIRGQRVEIGEVEAHLLQHRDVRDAAVVPDESGEDVRLVAFVVAELGSAPPDGSLREFLREALPEYMIPAAFLSLPSLPLTPNGKVNRQALSERARDGRGRAGSPVPRSRRSWPRSGPRCSGWRGSGSTTTSSTTGGIRSWPCG